MTFACKCGFKLRVKAWPFYCQCGRTYADAKAEPTLRTSPKDDGIPCDHRGEKVGAIKCGCQGTQHTYRCSSPAVESGLCILRYMEKMPREYRQWQTCLMCPHRVLDGEPQQSLKDAMERGS